MATTSIQIFESDGKRLRALPTSIDPFAIFGIERSAVVDTAPLRKAFLDLSRRIHPDRHQAAGGEQLARAEAWTGLLNKAHATLRDQRERVLWLLRDAGLIPDGDGEAEGTAGVPKELLAEVFELRELLEEYADSRSDALRSQIESARRDFARRLESNTTLYSESAAAWDADDRPRAAALAHGALGEEHFHRRLLGEIDSVLSTSGPIGS